jgi:hypothetical protein
LMERLLAIFLERSTDHVGNNCQHYRDQPNDGDRQHGSSTSKAAKENRPTYESGQACSADLTKI